ncbi:MAG: arginine repressor [Clostridia bacterium]|nr:arginine repressor [Clostridia bacterium]
MKIHRHAKILEIIQQKDIETQEELTDELRNIGIDVTQATISRDIKELRLTKVLAESGKYKYAYIEQDGESISNKLIRVFSDSIISINHVNNLIVIKTLTGSAHAAAAAVDSFKYTEILGTIAGDDTILVIVQTNEIAEALVKKFKKLLD